MGFDGEPAEKIEHILTNPTTRTCSKVEGKKELGNIIWVGRYCQNLYNRGRAANFPLHGPGHVTSRAAYFPTRRSKTKILRKTKSNLIEFGILVSLNQSTESSHFEVSSALV